MSVSLSFDLNLKERVSAGLDKLHAHTRSVFTGIDNTVKGTQRYLDKLGEEQKIRVDTSELDRAHGKMKEVASTWEVMKGTMLGEMAFRGIETGIDKVKEFLKSSLEAGMDEKRVQTIMNVMKGDEGGKELYENIHKYLLQVPYGTQLYGAGKSLTAIGLNSEQVMEKLHQFGEIAGGDKGNMDQLVDTYSLVKGTGHINLQELRPLLKMGFNPEEILMSKYRGKQSQWHERMEDATNGVKYFEEALRLATTEGGKFHDFMKKYMETDAGKYTLAVTNWENTKSEFGQKMLPVMGRILDKLGPAMDRLPSLLERTIPAIEKLGDGVVKLIEWTTTNTHEIKESAVRLWHLTEGVVGLTAAITLWKSAGAFMGGLKGVGELAGVEGAALAGGGWKMAGAAAGAFEATTSVAVGTALGAVGGLAAIAYTAYWLWDQHQHKDENTAKYTTPGGTVRKVVDPGYSYGPGQGLTDVRPDLDDEKKWGKYKPKKGSPFANEDKMPEWMKSAQAAEAASNAIVGGGSKQVTMNFNAPLYHVDRQVFQKVEDGMKDFDDGVKQAVRRLLYGIPGLI